MSDEENGHGKSPLDRLEEFTETLLQEHIAFAEEHKKLLTAQVVLNDQLQSLSALQKDLTESHKHTDERMNALIAVVDDLIRKRTQ
jgi:peptidoglycan hydrolase CwlO-like protein